MEELIWDYRTGDVIDPRTGEVVDRIYVVYPSMGFEKRWSSEESVVHYSPMPIRRACRRARRDGVVVTITRHSLLKRRREEEFAFLIERARKVLDPEIVDIDLLVDVYRRLESRGFSWVIKGHHLRKISSRLAFLAILITRSCNDEVVKSLSLAFSLSSQTVKRLCKLIRELGWLSHGDAVRLR